MLRVYFKKKKKCMLIKRPKKGEASYLAGLGVRNDVTFNDAAICQTSKNN
jgi:hypothetical protein